MNALKWSTIAIGLGLGSLLASLAGVVRAWLLHKDTGRKLTIKVDNVELMIENFHGTSQEIAEIEDLKNLLKEASPEQQTTPPQEKPTAQEPG